jgi:hypothetical protein
MILEGTSRVSYSSDEAVSVGDGESSQERAEEACNREAGAEVNFGVKDESCAAMVAGIDPEMGAPPRVSVKDAIVECEATESASVASSAPSPSLSRNAHAPLEGSKGSSFET